jgi:hypothetical protein
MEIQDAVVKISGALSSSDWNDPITKIGLFQALYRFLAFGNKDYLVLHASAAVTPRGATVAFGDNILSTRGKTSCALEIASLSGTFIVDEFVLYRVDDQHIFSNPYRPIHFKGDICKYLREKHGMNVKDTKLASPVGIFTIKTDLKLDALVAPYMDSETSKMLEMRGQERSDILKATAFSHLAKLLHPELDRSSLITGTDSSEVKDMKSVLKDFPDVDLAVPVYKVYLKSLEDLNNLLKEKGL